MLLFLYKAVSTNFCWFNNRFVNTMTQEPRVEQLLPLKADEDEGLAHHWDYIYEAG